MFSDETIFAPVSGNLSSELGDEVVILNVEMGKYYGMNPVASWIWTRLKEPVSFGGLRQGIQEAFSVDRETCEKDLNEFLRNLVDAGLIEVRRVAA
ncbi:MAG: PqqD family peptide modification chaperone [Rhodothermales bacterium]|nr:PqqD family peptide modification chaperone [Rhodothermales bacterium]